MVKAMPHIQPKFHPCAWQAFTAKGCNNEKCGRCANQKTMLQAKVPLTPVPKGLLEKLRAASTPAIAAAMRTSK